MPMSQRADVKVDGWVRDSQSTVGDLLDYSLRIDRVIFGTDADESLEGDDQSGYIDGRGGNDTIVGSAMSEEIVGGAGDDNLDGGAGDDLLRDSEGNNTLSGGEGDDIIDVSGNSTPTATIDGGEGLDTLKISSNTNWDNLTVTSIEAVDGSGGYTELAAQTLLDRGITQADNIEFRLDTYSSNDTVDVSGLSGNINLRGTNQSDTLIGNDDNNTIYLRSNNNDGNGYGADTVIAGAGDDTIRLDGGDYHNWHRVFSDYDSQTNSYLIKGAIDVVRVTIL
jgi:Ca2+-binding RTX toxin-like protein